MKKLIFALTFLLSTAAFAENYIPIPDGFYSGTGTWTDNFGAGGTWSMVHQISQSGLHHEFSAQFSDGRQFNGTVDEIFSTNSNATYVTQVNGHAVTVGTAVTSPAAYQTTIALSPTDTILEFGRLTAKGAYERNGTITNSQSGRSTFVEIILNKAK